MSSRNIVTEKVFSDDSFLIDFANFYITDICKNIDGVDCPFYLRHDLSKVKSFTKLELLDCDMRPVSSDDWIYFDETDLLKTPSKSIYTNLQCLYDGRDNSYETYYVKYLDTETNQVVIELLNSEPFYSQASFFSERNKRELIITDTEYGYQVNVVFDSLNYSPTNKTGDQRFFVRNREKGKVFIERPAANLISQRWNLQVSPGDFRQNGRRYWVPEYYTQGYSPAFPYKLEKEREVMVIDDDLLYCNLNPIANLGIGGFFIYISIKDSNGALISAITNDPDADVFITKNGFVTDIFYQKDAIQSISSNSGFIKLKERLPEGARAFMTFRYIENYYTYTQLSVNPSITPEILGKRILMYIIPDQGERSIHHIVVDDMGMILESSETELLRSFEGQSTGGSIAGLTDETLPSVDYFSGYEIEILSGKNSGMKLKINSYDTSSRTIAFKGQLPFAIEKGVFYRVIKKIDDYSSKDPLTGEINTYTGWEGFAKTRFYKKLADVYVVQNLNISDIESYEARVLGGGLKDSKIDAALQLQDEARWFWDIGNIDGTPYPGMGAILVELPRYILKELGGSFERPQVKEIVLRHMADGSYPVIKYYDSSTEITKIVPTNGKVYIEWGAIDASQYNIYIGNSADNVFLYASQPGTRNSITITGLENNKIYYTQVEPVIGGKTRLRSRTVSFMPFDYSDAMPRIKYGEGKYIGAIYG